MKNYIVTVFNNETIARQIIGIATNEEKAELIINAHQKKATLMLDEDNYEDYRVEEYEMDTMIYDLGI